jgi:hypothetical protein
VIGLLRDFEVPGDAGHVCPFGEQLVGLSELADNLFR